VAAAPASLAPALALPAAPPAPRTLSYSAISLWRACGYRFYLQRILGLAEESAEAAAADAAGFDAAATAAGTAGVADAAAAEEVPGLEARLRGTLVHELLEEDGPAAERLAGVAARHEVELTDAEAADVLRLAEAFARSPLAKRIAKARSVHREHGFDVPLAGMLLTGIVDVLALERGGAQLVVDYKTDALAPGADVGAYVDERYGLQRSVYALAALRGGAPAVEVAYAFLERPLEPVARRYEPADADGLEQELLDLAAGMLTGSYPVTDAPHRDLCLTCPGRKALCSHPEELTLRERPAAP
jgi:RecB family exonuclease